MAANIAEVGMIEPLPVFIRAEDGKCELLAGERRFRAAQEAGLKEVPVAPQASRDRRIAFAENHHREDFDPIATARDLRALGEERELGTVKEIAAAAGKKPEWVGLHLRLLKLPEGVQEAIAAGRVSVKAERELRQVAKVSPAVAEWLCEWARRQEVTATQFAEDFHEVFLAAGRSREDGKPTMISSSRFLLSEVIPDPAQHQELAERYRAAQPLRLRRGSPDPPELLRRRRRPRRRVPGRAHRHRRRRLREQRVVHHRRRPRRRPRQARDRAGREGAPPRGRRPAGSSGRPDPSPAKDAEPEETPQARAKRLKEKAVAFNEVLWGKVLKLRTPGRRKRASLQRAKAAMLVMIASNEDLAGAGLRLVWPQLQEVEETELKNGKTRRTVTYADRAQCTAALVEKVNGGQERRGAERGRRRGACRRDPREARGPRAGQADPLVGSLLGAEGRRTSSWPATSRPCAAGRRSSDCGGGLRSAGPLLLRAGLSRSRPCTPSRPPPPGCAGLPRPAPAGP